MAFKRRFLSNRHTEVDLQQRHLSSSILRVMQWNILADALSHSTSTTNFIKCSQDQLKWTNRGKRILDDILLYAPDLICLEEVDHFHDYFVSSLREQGYDGYFVAKPDSACLRVPGHTMPDGCALFVKKDRLEIREVVETCLKTENDGGSSNQVALLAEIRDMATNHTFIAAVCHLKAKPENIQTRLLQGRYLLSKMKAMKSYSEVTPILLAGDFNAEPDELVCNEMRTFGLNSSYFSASNLEALFTTWKYRPAGEVQHTIDYIWHSSHFQVENFLEIPSKVDIGETGLPAADFPSDHLSLLFDYTF